MTPITVVIPIGPGHADIARRAIASVETQTERCDLLPVYDLDGHGAGWTRNQGLAKVQTPFVVFLDADDWLEPTFAERTLAVRTARHYVYTDWYNDDVLQLAPDKPWCGGNWHVVTALLPTNWAQEVGGFDETLPAAEDTDFYLKLVTRRLCGQRLNEPLFHYSGHGLRSQALERSGRKDALMAEIGRRYTGKMGCCGNNPEIENLPQGEKLDTDVLAVALWGGNQILRGRATGRMYPRTGNGKLAWVDPRDVAAMPDKWKVAPPEPTVDMPQDRVLTTTADLGAIMNGAAQRPNVYTYPPPEAGAELRPDVQRVLTLGRK